MPYKTILVLADPAGAAPTRNTLAALVAGAQDAHLVGVAMSGAEQAIFQCNAAAPGLVVSAVDLGGLTRRADADLAAFTSQVRRLGVHSFETRRIDGVPDMELVMQARYADLLVLPPALDESLPPRLPDSALQYLILHCGKPVLVVPRGAARDDAADYPAWHALLAWDGSLEAARAISAALPLLQQVPRVTLAVYNGEEKYGAHGAVPGADMATYLARHGLKVDLVERHEPGAVGEALLSLAADLQAGLLVMGCYGHSRLREIVLGGATRDVLRGMTLPVLMAH